MSAGREVPGWARAVARGAPLAHGISSQRREPARIGFVAGSRPPCSPDRVGERFDATVLELRDGSAVSSSPTPPSPRPVRRDRARPGERLPVVLESADIASGAVQFALAD